MGLGFEASAEVSLASDACAGDAGGGARAWCRGCCCCRCYRVTVTAASYYSCYVATIILDVALKP